MVTTKIFNGTTAIRGAIPHQVSIRNVRGGGIAHFCGGSIIHSVLILTAAHCITKLNLEPEQIVVVAGEHILDATEEGEQARYVTQIIIHGGWNTTTSDNDIAILVLNEPLLFDNYTRPIEIAKGDDVRSGKQKDFTRTVFWQGLTLDACFTQIKKRQR